MKKMGLGRGLDALLPDSDLDAASVTQIPLNEIDRNPAQPRRKFDEEALNALSESIRSSGVLSPLLVVEAAGRYRIVAGERRFRAAKLAGLETVPCIVRDLTRQQEMEAALIENLQREDLNAIEEATAIRALMDQCGYTQENAAKRLGKSRPAVANLLRILSLEDDMRQAVADGVISAGHARVLVGIEDRARRRALFEKTRTEALSVRALETLAAQPAPVPSPVGQKKTRVLAPELSDMQERLQSAVGVRTTLTGNGKKGRVVLNYSNEDELELIYSALEVLEKR
jgi:ParB family chromosome partitioning protein